MKIPVIADLPVGENVQDHTMFFVKADINDSISVTTDKVNNWWTWIQYHVFGTGYLSTSAAVESVGFVCTDPNDQAPSYHCPDVELIFFSSLAEHGEAYSHFNYKKEVEKEVFKNIHNVNNMPEGFTIALETTHPRSKGTIRLKTTDPFDYPLIDIKYFEDPYDVQPIVRGVKLIKNMLQTEEMKRIVAKLRHEPFTKCLAHTFDSEEYWECMVRHLAVSGYHISASCKMGPPSDKTSVVDPELKCRSRCC